MNGNSQHPARGRHHIPVIFRLMFSLAVVVAQTTVFADEPSVTPRKPSPLAAKKLRGNIREQRIPVQQISDLLTNEWQPLKLDEYRALRKKTQTVQPGPKTTRIDRAEYFAVLTDATLNAGRLIFDVKQMNAQSEFMILDPLNLALTELSWEKTRALWGTMDDGRLVVRVDRPSGRLKGNWTLKGRRIGSRLDFNIQLPPATVSQINLQVPAGWMLESSTGQVTGPYPTPTLGWAGWRIDLGSHSQCRLIARRPQQVASSRSVILLKNDVTYVVQRGGLQVQLRTVLDVSGAPAKSVSFHLPQKFNVFSVLFGRDQKLSHRVVSSPSGQILRIQFPRPVHGTLRPITIQAAMAGTFETELLLPQIRPLSGLFLSGNVYLRVVPPLSIQSLKTVGLRQTDPLVSKPSSETLTFHQWDPRARLHLRVGLPRPNLSANVVSHLDLSGDQWQATSETQWVVKNGPLFTLESRLLPGWKINEVRVRSTATNAESEIQANWSLKRGPKGSRILVIDLPDAFTPGNPVTTTITASRPQRVRGRRIGIPVITPSGCDSVQHILGVRHRTGVTPLNVRSQRTIWNPTLPADVPLFAKNFSLFKKMVEVNEPTLTLLACNASSSFGSLLLSGDNTAVDARAWSFVSIGDNRVNQHSVVTVKPLGRPIEQVVVYLTSKGRNSSWKTATAGESSLTSVRLPVNRHADWGLPLTGELWELRFEKPHVKDFQILLDRNIEFTGPLSPGLPFVPDARNFHGTVEIMPNGKSRSEVSIDGLQPVVDRPTELALRPKNVLPSERPGQLWNYRNTESHIQLNPSSERNAIHEVSTAEFRLRSILSSSDGNDLHTGTFHLNSTATPGRFNFTFPEQARVVSVRLNGSVVHPSKNTDSFSLQPLPPNRLNVVEIRYTSPSPQTTLRTLHDVILPGTSLTVTKFQWDFALPPHLRLAASPDFGILSSAIVGPSWTKRFFGPLGRPVKETIFNPFLENSWRRLFGEPPTAQAFPAADEAFFAPKGWNRYTLTTASLPEPAASIDVWNQVKARRIAWVTLLGCLGIGLLLRRRRTVHRGRIASFWISSCVIAAWLVPDVYAEIVGSGLLGGVLAALVPRNFILPAPQRVGGFSRISQGSTASYPRAATTLLLFILGGSALVIGSTFADEIKPRSPTGNSKNTPSTSVDNKATLLITEETVIIPVESENAEKSSVPIVYLHQNLLTRLRQMAAVRHPSPAYVIRSADYQSHVDERNSVTIEAKLHVDVFGSNFPVRVRLPFKNVELSGVAACLVNQRIQPVRRDENGDGFIIALAKPASSKRQKPRSVTSKMKIAPASFGTSMSLGIDDSANLDTPFEITLKFHVPAGEHLTGRRMTLGIPSVASSRMSLTFAKPFTSISVENVRGQISSQSTSGRSSTIDLGRTDRFTAYWTDTDQPKDNLPESVATVLQLVEVRPTSLEYRIRVKYDVQQGQVEQILWSLPRGALVRKIAIAGSANGVETFQLLPRDNRSSQLHIELTEPQKKPFLIEATMTLPRAMLRLNDKRAIGSAIKIAIPVIDLFSNLLGTHPAFNKNIKPVMQMIGIQTTPEFDLTLKAGDFTSLTQIAPEDLVKSVVASEEIKQPEFAFRFQKAIVLPGELTHRAPKRRVRQTETVRVWENHFDWTFHAQVETTVALAMQHRLSVDPKFKIESVTAIQDEAPRLVRWSRTGSQLTLFLSNKSSGMQTVSITGRLPFTGIGERRLPGIRFLNATTESADLLLYRDATLQVELNDPDLVERSDLSPQPKTPIPMGNSPVKRPAENQGVFVGAYRRLRVEGPLPRIDIRRRNKIMTYDILTKLSREDGGAWTISTLIHFPKGVTSDAEVQFQIPRDLVEHFKIQSDIKHHEAVRHPDGTATITLQLMKKQGKEFTITISSTMIFPRQGNWQLPEIGVSDWKARQNYLLIPKVANGVSVLPPAIKRTLEALPGWAKHLLQEETTLDENLFHQREASWKLLRAQSKPSKVAARVSLMETRTWFSTDSYEQGQTEMVLTGNTGDSFSINLPEGISVRATLVNGKSVETTPPIDGILVLPLKSVRSVTLVSLHWTRTQTQSILPIRIIHREFPSPRSFPVSISLFTALKSPRSRTVIPTGLETTGQMKYQLDRIEGLLAACELEHKIDGQRPSLWDSTHLAHARLKRRQQPVRGSTVSPFPAIKKRIQEIDKRFESLKRLIQLTPIPTNEEPLATLSLSSSPPETGENVFWGRWSEQTETPTVSFWTFDRSMLSWLLGLGAFLVFAPIIRRIIKLETGELLSRWEPVSWTVLGLIWWLCLTPSLIGMLLVVAAGFRAVVRRRKAKRESKTVLISG
jgi:hypothetical protein